MVLFQGSEKEANKIVKVALKHMLWKQMHQCETDGFIQDNVEEFHSCERIKDLIKDFEDGESTVYFYKLGDRGW